VDLPEGEIDARDHGLVEGDILMVTHQFANGKTDFFGCQLVGCHLVSSGWKV